MSYSQVLANDGGESVLQAYRNRGDNPSIIHSCFVEFSLVSVQPISDAQFEEEASRRRAGLLRALEGHSEPERMVDELERTLREGQLTPQHLRGTYLYRFTDDQQRQSLFTVFYQNIPDRQSMPTTVISEAGPQRVTSAYLNTEGRALTVLRYPGFVANFYQMGRIKGEPINNLLNEAERTGVGVASILTNAGYQVTGTETYDDNSQMYLVELRRNGRLVERYGIDPSKGYICPIVQVFDEETGHLTEEYISRGFFLHAGSGLWFPTSFLAKRYNALTGELVSRQEYTINAETIRINQPVSEHEFSIDIPAGFRVDDVRTDTSIRYTAHSEGVVSLAPGGLDLGNMGWLSREMSIDDFIPSTGGVTGWVRWLLMSTGIILVLFGIYSIWKKRNAV